CSRCPRRFRCFRDFFFQAEDGIRDVAVTGVQTCASDLCGFIFGILRNELGFQGVIMTDSLTMEGITAYYTEDQAAAVAIEAGSEIGRAAWREGQTRGENPRIKDHSGRSGYIACMRTPTQ